MGLASMAWESLTDEQRLAWNAEGKSRRSTGQKYFTGINARRLRDGQEPLTELPARSVYSGKLILKRLLIRNRAGRITLKLAVSLAPGVRVTVWGSRPCNRGVSRSPKCPRLGELPAPEARAERYYGALLPKARRVYEDARRAIGWEADLYSHPGGVGRRPGSFRINRCGRSRAREPRRSRQKRLNPMEYLWTSYGSPMELLWSITPATSHARARWCRAGWHSEDGKTQRSGD